MEGEKLSDKKQIKIDVGNDKDFFYKGIILKDENGFITFMDDKLGKIELNRQRIISIEDIGEEYGE